MKDFEYRRITAYTKDRQCSIDVNKTNFLFFNLLQTGSSNLYQVFSHTNVTVCILELTADVRHQDICTNHTHTKCSHETLMAVFKTSILQTNKQTKKKIMNSMFSEYSQSSKPPPHYSLIFPHVSLLL